MEENSGSQFLVWRQTWRGEYTKGLGVEDERELNVALAPRMRAGWPWVGPAGGRAPINPSLTVAVPDTAIVVFTRTTPATRLWLSVRIFQHALSVRHSTVSS